MGEVKKSLLIMWENILFYGEIYTTANILHCHCTDSSISDKSNVW